MDNKEPSENRNMPPGGDSSDEAESAKQPADADVGSNPQSRGKSSKQRKVAKTKLELDFSPTDLTAEESRLIEGLLTQKPTKRKVAKTMLETSLPAEALEAIAGQAAPEQSSTQSPAQSQDGTATQTEGTVKDDAANRQQVKTPQKPTTAAGQQSSGSKRKVAKTMLETSIPTGAADALFDEVVPVVDSSVSSVEPDSGSAADSPSAVANPPSAAEPPSAAAASLPGQPPTAQSPPGGKRRVAKTMLETNIPDAAFDEPISVIEPVLPPEPLPESPPVSIEPKPKRKIAKTMLETAIPDVFFEEAVSVVDAASPDAPVKRLKRVSKTLLELPTDFMTGESLTGTAISPEMVLEASPQEGPQRFVAKTMLDLSVLDAALERAAKKKEEQAIELAKEKAAQPVKVIEPVKADRYARTCPWRWDGVGDKDRFRYCGQCHLPVYNFEGLDKSEAEAIIFIREDRRDCKLYERSDGKFMTSDCAVALQKQRNFLMLIVGGTIAVIGFLTLLLMIPKPQTVATPTPDPFQQPTLPAQPGLIQPQTAKGTSTRTGSTSSPGVASGTSSTSSSTATPASSSKSGYHWKAGDPLPSTTTAPEPVVTPPTPEQTVQPDPDESGNFWQFTNRGGGNN